MPLAVYIALETNPDAAIVLSLVLLAVSIIVLASLRDKWINPESRVTLGGDMALRSDIIVKRDRFMLELGSTPRAARPWGCSGRTARARALPCAHWQGCYRCPPAASN